MERINELIQNIFESELTKMISKMIKEIVDYRNLSMTDEKRDATVLSLICYRKTFDNLSVFEFQGALETLKVYGEFRILSANLLHETLRAKALEKSKKEDRAKMKRNPFNEVWATALQLKIRDYFKTRESKHSIKEVYESVKKGINIYTGEEIKN
jgi:hypothetical protein